MMCLGVFLLWSNFFGTHWASWISWKSVFFARLGKFSFIICSNTFSNSCSSSSPSGTPMIQMLEHLKMSWRFLSLSSFFWILVSSFCSGWMFLSSFWSKPLIWVLVSFLSLLVPCRFFFLKKYIYWLWYYSGPIFPPHSNPSCSPPPSRIPPPIVHVHGSYL